MELGKSDLDGIKDIINKEIKNINPLNIGDEINKGVTLEGFILL